MSEAGGARTEWVVVGGSGFVGSHLVHHLASLGLEVSVLTAPRTAPPGESTADDIARACRADPRTLDLAERFRTAAVVVMAAGLAAPDSTDRSALVGANAVAPGVVAVAAGRAGVPRLLHLSSAAVQGRRAVLTEEESTAPFSPYSWSKALGEEVLRALGPAAPARTVVVRATSVQGRERPTTRALRRFAASRLSSVAGSGRAPSAVSSVGALAALLHHVGSSPVAPPPVVLQPWEGLSVAEVLRAAGGREPRHLPPWSCRSAVAAGFTLARLLGGRGQGAVRRAEVMWFGQEVDARWAGATGFPSPAGLAELLAGGDPEHAPSRP